MDFILGEGGCVRERLADVLFFEVWKFRDYLGRCQTVCNQVDNVRYGDAKPADGGSPGQDIRVLGDAIERFRHGQDEKGEALTG
jgi:hypothetical protein